LATALPASVAALLLIACVPVRARAQQKATDVSTCALAQNPKSYDQKLVRVRGALHVEFEDFSLGLGNCQTEQSIWLAFGGDVPGIVASTVNDTARTPGKKIRAHGIPVGITENDDFRRLYALISSRNGQNARYRVTATLTGMFFAGRATTFSDGTPGYVGYGHLGCCSLLVITEVSGVESAPVAKLDLSGVVVGPDERPLGGITVIDDIVGGSPPVRQTTVTDARGRFAFSISGRQLRIENTDYRPVAMTVHPGGSPVRLKLANANQSDWTIRACDPQTSGSRIGFAVLFTVPASMESKKFDSGDVHSFFIYARGSSEFRANLIISRESHLAIDEADSIGTAWQAERWIRGAAGKVIGIDAQGRSANDGEYFRSLSFSSGDLAGYSGLRAGEPLKTANQTLDSACLAPQYPRN
jgi:hypothetical protein